MLKNKLLIGLLAMSLCACSTGNKNQANALDEDSYQAILPYESSDTRSKHVGLIQDTDLRVEMESGLMDLSKKYFSPTAAPKPLRVRSKWQENIPMQNTVRTAMRSLP